MPTTAADAASHAKKTNRAKTVHALWAAATATPCVTANAWTPNATANIAAAAHLKMPVSAIRYV